MEKEDMIADLQKQVSWLQSRIEFLEGELAKKESGPMPVPLPSYPLPPAPIPTYYEREPTLGPPYKITCITKEMQQCQ